MTDDKLMRECGYCGCNTNAKLRACCTPGYNEDILVNREVDKAVRAAAMECAIACERLARELELGTSASCWLAAKQIRARFGLEE